MEILLMQRKTGIIYQSAILCQLREDKMLHPCKGPRMIEHWLQEQMLDGKEHYATQE